MLDRVTVGGQLTGWAPHGGLVLAYPLGGALTHGLLHAVPHKIVLVRHDVAVAFGGPPCSRPPPGCGPHLRGAPLEVA
jgi:hypothetical protein